MKPAVIPKDLAGKDLFDFLVKHEGLIFHAKKSQVKEAFGIFTPKVFIDENGALVSKEINMAPTISVDATKIAVDLVINTTNFFDSHYDVHIDGLWNKNLKENKEGFYLLNRHKQGFEDVIGEGLRGRVAKMAWKDLGFDFVGMTEALMFKGQLDKLRNQYMFNQYAKRYVKQHSVGMRYVKMVTCINDDDYPVQKENWDKYFPVVINKKDCEDAGFFWAVLEAKVQEGSAVLFGSNCLTPSYCIEECKFDSTGKEAGSTTSEQPQKFDILEAIKNTKFLV